MNGMQQRRSGERGQILPLVAVGMITLMGMVSLAVDAGYWRYQQRLEQSAADSAAIAGAIRLNYQRLPRRAHPRKPHKRLLHKMGLPTTAVPGRPS